MQIYDLVLRKQRHRAYGQHSLQSSTLKYHGTAKPSVGKLHTLCCISRKFCNGHGVQS